LYTPIVVRNTLVGRLRPRSARGRLLTKPERLCFCVSPSPKWPIAYCVEWDV